MKNVKLYPVVKHAKKQVFSMVRAVFSITYFRLTRYNFSGAQGFIMPGETMVNLFLLPR